MSLPAHQRRLVVQAARLNIPVDVSIELTHHCNFRCQHCYIPDFSAPDLLSTERLLSLLEELADVGTLFLTLTGGELFLRRDWLTIAGRARELGFALRLFSNGTLIDDEVADQIAEQAEFFSFGTNDLTQTAYGFSRDDAGTFLDIYHREGVLEQDPFVSIDQEGVGELVEIGVERGRKTRPDIKLGICGEHGGDPASVAFCHRVGLTYVSCSPYRVPIARLAAAQAALADK